MKRLVAIILCMCMFLAGCQKDRGQVETDQTSAENTQNETKDTTATADDSEKVESGDNENEDTATQLLTLNKAWSLVQTVALETPEYEVPYYKADVTPFTIEEDMSNIENINQFEGFTKEQVTMLVKNGFVVLPSMDTRAYYVYDDNEYKGIPNFITSDSVLHLYHQFYDKSLMGIEANYLYQDLDLMTEQMLLKSTQLYTQLTDEELKKIQEKNIVYFMVARMLMQPDAGIAIGTYKEHADLAETAKQEYDLIQAAEGITMSPLFGVDLDYSQFTVRGHYTRTEELARYFKAMMWFGYAPLEFVNDQMEIQIDNVIQALLITYTTIADSEKTCDAELWSNIYQPTAQYVGLSDDVNVFTMNGLRSKVFGEDENPDIYNDEEYRSKLEEAVKALPEPQIQGKIETNSQVTGKQFRFMGQRYVLDADILQTLMEPFKRPMPTALDVMGVLGSNTAENLLFQVYKPQEVWPAYSDKYKELKTEVSGYEEDYWQTNLYTGWLSAIRDVLTEYDEESGMPWFMTTEAWKNKSLNTALGSYAELKHDTVLYGKQAMAEMGGPIATSELHYVEPDVELYYKLQYLTAFTCDVLKDKDMLNDQMQNGAETFQSLLKLLINCSIKELNNEPLTDEENRQLLWYGGTMEDILNSVLYGAQLEGYSKDATDMLVTDIATVQNQYLTLATGYFDNIYVVIPYEGKLYLSRGSVYSSYEFVSDKRLTDEEWWALQGINVVKEEFGEYVEFGEPSSELPAQPDWIHTFKSGTNDVIITSLEVLWENLEE